MECPRAGISEPKLEPSFLARYDNLPILAPPSNELNGASSEGDRVAWIRLKANVSRLHEFVGRLRPDA